MIMMNKFTPLTQQPCDDEGPVFGEPWHAQAFALAVHLSDLGLFSWKEFSKTINDEISKAQKAGDPDLGNTYYEHWLNALEVLARKKGVFNIEELLERKEKWRNAYLRTPHGDPVELNDIKL